MYDHNELSSDYSVPYSHCEIHLHVLVFTTDDFVLVIMVTTFPNFPFFKLFYVSYNNFIRFYC